MDIGMKWIVGIIIALILVLLVSYGIFQKFVPVAEEATEVKVAMQTSK